ASQGLPVHGVEADVVGQAVGEVDVEGGGAPGDPGEGGAAGGGGGLLQAAGVGGGGGPRVEVIAGDRDLGPSRQGGGGAGQRGALGAVDALPRPLRRRILRHEHRRCRRTGGDGRRDRVGGEARRVDGTHTVVVGRLRRQTRV